MSIITLLKNFDNTKTRLITRKANHGALMNVIAHEKLNIDELKGKVQELVNSITLMQTFSNTLRSDVITKFEDLITKGVREVFQKDYKISIEFQNSGNTVHADFIVTLPGGKKVNLKTGEGGGLRDFIAVLQRILYIILEPSRPSKVLFLDECLKALDVKRSPLAFRFISRLTKELGIQVVFITHCQAAKDLGDAEGISVLEVTHDDNGSSVFALPSNEKGIA